MTEKKIFRRSKSFYIKTGIFLLLITAGLIFWNNFKYRLANRKLDKLVTTKSKGLYQVNYQNLVIDEALGNLSVENIEMLPDSLVYQSMIENKTAPKDLFFIRIPAIHISGVKTPRALLNKEISAHSIRIENADIEIRLGKGDGDKKPDFKQIINGEMYQQLLGNLKSISADSIVLENASLTLLNRESRTIISKVTGLSIRFAGTAIDSAALKDSTRILFSKEIGIHCNQLLIPSRNKIYEFRIEGLDFNNQAGSFHTDQIHLKPLLSETAFAKLHKYAKDRFDITVGSLNLKLINRKEMLLGRLVADELQIRQASIHVFRDKSYPHDSVDRTHGYPQEAIMLLPFEVYIKNILVNDSYIEYKEKNDKSDSSGKVAFFHVQAGIENVTNMKDRIRQQNQMRVQFNASFLNAAPFTAKIQMRLNDRQGHFTLDARLGSIGNTALNPLLKPMALAEMDKGNIDQLVYHMDATNTYARGNLDFLYKDLSLKLLKKDDEKNIYKTKALPTLAAGLVMRHSNPLHGTTRTGNVDYTRDIHRSIFNLMWKSLLSGIKQIAL
jgi:hypothetical protein